MNLPPAQDGGLLDWLAYWAQVQPDAPAFRAANANFTYGQLWGGVTSAAAWLNDQGVREGQTVACVFGLNPHLAGSQIELFYGLVWLGAVVLPIYPGTVLAQAQQIVTAFSAKWLLQDANTENALKTRQLSVDSYQNHKTSHQTRPVSMQVQVPMRQDEPTRPCLYEFSSGTTGVPKAVLMSGQTYMGIVHAAIRLYQWQPDDVLLTAVRWPSKVGLRGLVRALRVGASHADANFPDTRAKLTHVMQHLGVTCVSSSPWQMRRLLDDLERSQSAETLAAAHPLSEPSSPFPLSQPVPFATPTPTGLRTFITAGASVFAQDIQRARTFLTDHFYVAYGSTEAGTIAKIGPGDDAAGPLYLVEGVQAQAIDDQGLVLPPGVPGRLRLRSDWVCQGYVGQADQSAGESGFKDDWFYSSDFGSVQANGELTLLGRMDDVVNFGGIKINPDEVEEVLMQHPAITEAALMGLPDAAAGEIPVALVVLRGPVSAQALGEFLSQHLPSEHIPRTVQQVAQLPRNVDGKLLRGQLPSLYAQTIAASAPQTTPQTTPQNTPPTTAPTQLAAVEPALTATDPLSGLALWVAQKPDAVAFHHAGQTTRFGQLWLVTEHTATWLHSQGVRPGNTVALVLEFEQTPMVRQVALMYAAAWLGATVLPLYAGSAPSEHASLMARFGADFYVSEKRLEDASAPVAPNPLDSPNSACPWLPLSEAAQFVPAPTDLTPPRVADPLRPFIYMFSSGTTANPKVVLFTAGQMVAQILAVVQQYRCQPDDVMLPSLPWPSKVGLRVMLRALFVGAAFVNAPFPETRQALVGHINTLGLTGLDSTPWQLRRLLASPASPEPATRPLRYMSTAGAFVEPAEIEAARSTLCGNFHVAYASTETGMIAQLYAHHPADGKFKLARGVQVQAVAQDGSLLPPGQTGLLRIRSAWCASGYAMDPVASAACFRDGWFYSSDLGSVDAVGFLSLAGRADDTINFGGAKIQPQAVEQVLRLHPAIADAAVVGIGDSMAGQIPVAFVVFRGQVDEAQMRAFLAPRLDQWQYPSALIGVNAIPRNAQGKVQREVLRQLYAQSKPPTLT